MTHVYVSSGLYMCVCACIHTNGDNMTHVYVSSGLYTHLPLWSSDLDGNQVQGEEVGKVERIDPGGV